MTNVTLMKCGQLATAYETQLELVRRMKSLEKDLAGTEAGTASASNIIVNMNYVHKLIAAGNQHIAELTDMLLVG